MKKISHLVVTTVLLIASCGEEMPYANWHLGPGGFNPGTKFAGPTLDCDQGQSGCQPVLDEYGYAYPEIQVVRQAIDSFYVYYAAGNLSAFYSNFNLHSIFPEVHQQRPGALDSLIAGQYGISVLADSSIVIFRNPGQPLVYENIIFAYDRDAGQGGH
jgi:hypothetical protein